MPEDAPFPENNTAGTPTSEARSALQVTVFGCGTAGCNAVTLFERVNNGNTRTVAANTDLSHLQRTVVSSEKLLLSEKKQKKGTDTIDPRYGREVAHESLAEIEELVENQELVIVTAGLGGGTGTGAAPVVAESASKHGALTLAVVTVPFTAEGGDRRQNAKIGIEQLQRFVDLTLVIPTDRILDYAPEIPLEEAYSICDSVIAKSISTLVGIVSENSVGHASLEDVASLVEDRDTALIGIGEGTGEKRQNTTISTALQSPLLDGPTQDTTKMMAYLVGGADMTVDEAESVIEQLQARLDPTADILWGATRDDTLTETLETRLIVTGISGPEQIVTDLFATSQSDIDHSL